MWISIITMQKRSMMVMVMITMKNTTMKPMNKNKTKIIFVTMIMIKVTMTMTIDNVTNTDVIHTDDDIYYDQAHKHKHSSYNTYIYM